MSPELVDFILLAAIAVVVAVFAMICCWSYLDD